MAMFSDDAFNKSVAKHAAQGTLVGNWYEERVLREAVGEGRTVPQRHLPRSGLLKDFTKTVTGGPRAMDDTYERCVGAKGLQGHYGTSAQVIGHHDQETVDHVGPQAAVRRMEWMDAAEYEVQLEEAQLARRDQERSFHTTTGVTYSKPDEAQAQAAQHLRRSCQDEIRYGAAPDKMLAVGNEGLDYHPHVHYANVEGVTQARVALADPTSRSGLKVSACTGVSAFGKHAEFSKPINEFTRGLAKDEELASMYEGLKATRPLRTLAGGEPRAGAFAGVPSLAALKSTIHEKVASAWGARGYVTLRQRLYDCGDSDGYVSKEAIVSVMREQMGLSEEEVSSKALDAYMSQLVTMKKSELKVGSFLSSLRPVLLQKDRRRALEAFRALESSGGGAAQLGDWLSRLHDQELRAAIAAAFGAEGEEQVADMPLTEAVFLEVVSDLAPFMN
eukprot:CAMPEP_0168437450 /NCGR_PEP_ID=MMETSP0228-20121227/41443_1 /TAXON_ID=133427 /ORGANISM="Protoceratium reticulatum, Strain CCCM 535 (=CCMP 1889)" /LENGTH=445 /DNA_ID=CAMNT_0008451669 /DNA_START=45 /DNA_END=1379 /DNA_ORIENTATION=+